jgi:hypothetical protein
MLTWSMRIGFALARASQRKSLKSAALSARSYEGLALASPMW